MWLVTSLVRGHVVCLYRMTGRRGTGERWGYPLVDLEERFLYPADSAFSDARRRPSEGISPPDGTARRASSSACRSNRLDAKGRAGQSMALQWSRKLTRYLPRCVLARRRPKIDGRIARRGIFGHIPRGTAFIVMPLVHMSADAIS